TYQTRASIFSVLWGAASHDFLPKRLEPPSTLISAETNRLDGWRRIVNKTVSSENALMPVICTSRLGWIAAALVRARRHLLRRKRNCKASRPVKPNQESRPEVSWNIFYIDGFHCLY